MLIGLVPPAVVVFLWKLHVAEMRARIVEKDQQIQELEEKLEKKDSELREMTKLSARVLRASYAVEEKSSGSDSSPPPTSLRTSKSSRT